MVSGSCQWIVRGRRGEQLGISEKEIALGVGREEKKWNRA